MCWYCGFENAGIYCAAEGCTRVFHLTCGVSTGCHSEFTGNFVSYCHSHSTEFKCKDYADEECVICGDALGLTSDAITGDCCNGTYHRHCIGKLALSAGYFFKCPLCNNTEQFRRCMRLKGIFVPDRDASWELVANAYQDLYGPQYVCEAVVCASENGRRYSSSDWFTFLTCHDCGAASIHRKCCPTIRFRCQLCQELLEKKRAEAAAQLEASGQTAANNMLLPPQDDRERCSTGPLSADNNITEPLLEDHNDKTNDVDDDESQPNNYGITTDDTISGHVERTISRDERLEVDEDSVGILLLSPRQQRQRRERPATCLRPRIARQAKDKATLRLEQCVLFKKRTRRRIRSYE